MRSFPALIVDAGGERFAIHQLSVLELVRASSGGDHRIERIKDTPVLRLRNKLLPLINLEILQLGGSEVDKGFVVVAQVGSQIFGIVVDGVLHTEEIVIKPMSSKLRHIAAFSGTTILGDGTVIMIVDPNGVAQVLGRVTPVARANETELDDDVAAEEDLTPLLVFRAGSQQPKAVLLSLVSRLEEIDCRQIEISDGRHLLQYRDQLMPLLRIDTQTTIRQEGAQPILVFSDHGRSMGLVVDEIVDIVEQRLHRGGQRPAGGPRLRGGEGNRHGDCRHRPFPAPGLCRLVPVAGFGGRRPARVESCWWTTRRFSATCSRP